MKLTLLVPLLALAAVSLLELGVWTKLMWRIRRAASVMLALAVVATSGAVFVGHPRTWSAVLAILGLYRGFNLYRIFKGRMHEQYLKRVTRRTSVWLMVEQAAVLLLLRVLEGGWLSTMTRWQILASLQLLLTAILLVSTLRHVRTTREPVLTRSYPDRDLPTLSVAIPARNETEELEACLKSLIANDYPKLEILVLDDCSQNAKTPEIIRSFAHDGVRFVAGEEPEDTWLAKNLAYERLREEVNGEVLLFCGVDTRFSPGGLRRIVATLLEKDKTMLSIMPDNANFTHATALIQPVRYAWELALPRRLFQRPPVLSTCWMIKKAALDNAGGFKAVSRSIVPESYFARTTALNDGYAFIRSGEVTSEKPFAEQKATAIRTRYPQLHRRPEQIALVALGELFGLVGPFALLAFAATQQLWWAAGLSGAACLMLLIVYGIITSLAYRRFVVYGPLLMPLAVLYDAVLMNYSMLKYELSEVIWKGRNVCIPVMHVVPSLPKPE